MKDKWIKVTDKLPKLEYISPNWNCSTQCLCTNGVDIFVAYYQELNGEIYWDGYNRYDDITYWQKAELP